MSCLKRYLDNNGFALIELVVGIFILCILVVPAYAVLFSSSHDGVYSAGRQSSTLFEAQKKIENAINDAEYTDAMLTRENSYTIIITFNDLSPVNVTGEKLDILNNYPGVNSNNRSFSISTCVPSSYVGSE